MYCGLHTGAFVFECVKSEETPQFGTTMLFANRALISEARKKSVHVIAQANWLGAGGQRFRLGDSDPFEHCH